MNESGPHQKLWLVMSKFHMADLDTLKLYENPETDLIDPLTLTRKYVSMDVHTDVVMIFANFFAVNKILHKHFIFFTTILIDKSQAELKKIYPGLFFYCKTN